MKVRNGFVSNSSSSSFLIVSKNGDLTTEKLMKSFDVKEGSPLYTLVKGIAKDMMNSSTEYTQEDYMKEYMWGDWDVNDFEKEYPEMFELYQEAKEKGWKIYEGSADDVDQPTLCELSLQYEDDDIKIDKEGGY